MGKTLTGTELIQILSRVKEECTTPIDDTLTIEGNAADAKKTGDEISALNSAISENLYSLVNERTYTVQGGWQNFEYTINNGSTYLVTISNNDMGVYASNDGSSNVYRITTGTVFVASQTTNYIRIWSPSTQTVKITVKGLKIEEIETEMSAVSYNIDNGCIEIDKTYTWQSGYIDTAGKIKSSSLSGFAIIQLQRGETVRVGTNNSNITIIGSTTAMSLNVGDTVTVIKTTPTTSGFIEYTYTALSDISIVVCVRLSDYILHFYRIADCLANIEETIKRNENHIGRVLNCTNFYDVATTKYNWSIAPDGAEQSDETWCSSDYIEIDPSIKYELWNFNLKTKRTSNINVIFYDAEKNYITGVKVRANVTETATIKHWLHDFEYPTNAAYVRISFNGYYAQAVMLTEYKDGYPMIYRPYGFDIKPLRISQKYCDTIKNASKQGYNSLDRVTGHPTYPHSSIVSFLAAMEAGFNTITLAILYTSDGVPVLSHNNDISTIALNTDGTSITSPYKITEHTFSEIDAFDFGLMYGPQYEGLHILKLEDGLKFCKQYGCGFTIEIESGETKARLNSIAQIVKMYGLSERCEFFAYDTAKLSDIPVLLPYADIVLGSPSTDAAAVTLADAIVSANLINGKNHVYIVCEFSTILTQETINYIASNGILLSYSNPENEPGDITALFSAEKNMYITRVTSRVYPAGKVLYESATTQLTAVTD